MTTTTLFPMLNEVKVLVTNGEQDGEATITCPPFRAPTDEELRSYMDTTVAALPKGFRLMTRHEAQQYAISQRAGYQPGVVFALIKLEDDEEWHDPETSETRIASNAEMLGNGMIAVDDDLIGDDDE